MSSRNTIGLACIAVVAALAVPAFADDASPEKYLELLRSDLRTEKVEILTEDLDLTEAQAAAFWPIYREYDVEAAALGDRASRWCSDSSRSTGPSRTRRPGSSHRTGSRSRRTG